MGGATGVGYLGSSRSSSSSSSSNSAVAELEARFEASRGFDLEDDLEFCPALVNPHSQPHRQHHHPMPYINNHGLFVATSPAPAASVPLATVASPKVKRKGIEIVDPTTGLKLSGKVRM